MISAPGVSIVKGQQGPSAPWSRPRVRIDLKRLKKLRLPSRYPVRTITIIDKSSEANKRRIYSCRIQTEILVLIQKKFEDFQIIEERQMG